MLSLSLLNAKSTVLSCLTQLQLSFWFRILILVRLPETGSLQFWLSGNSQRFTCLYLMSAGIKELHPYISLVLASNLISFK